MSTRVRVLPPVSKRGLFILAPALGLAHGLIASWVIARLSDQIIGMSGPVSTFGMIRVALTIAVLFTLPAVPVGMLFTRVHPRIGRLLACGAFYGAACFGGVASTIVARNPETLLAPFQPNPTGPMDALLSTAFSLAFGAGVCAGAFSGMFVLAAGIERFIGKRVIEQNGLICWGCGYNLGATTITICPECGKAFDPHAPPRAVSSRLLAGLVSLRWAVVAITLLAALGPVAYLLPTHTLPSARFTRACPASATLQVSGMLGNYLAPRGRASPSIVQPLSHTWWIPDPESSTTGLAVLFVPQAHADEPSMYVIRAFMYDYNIPATAVIAGAVPKVQMLAPGTATIVARLSRAQAASVIESPPLPSGLADAIWREAQSQGWAPADPMVTPAAKQVVVEADPYFAPGQPDPAAGRTP